MNQMIVSLRFDKVKSKHIDGQGLDHGEYIRMQSCTVGMAMLTPKGDMNEVISITKGEEYDNIKFEIEFKNGETWVVFPVKPFDYGCEPIETKETDG